MGVLEGQSMFLEGEGVHTKMIWRCAKERCWIYRDAEDAEIFAGSDKNGQT